MKSILNSKKLEDFKSNELSHSWQIVGGQEVSTKSYDKDHNFIGCDVADLETCPKDENGKLKGIAQQDSIPVDCPTSK